MAHQLALFWIPGGKMIELRKRQREKRLARQARGKRHAPCLNVTLSRRSLCGYPVNRMFIVSDLSTVTCKSCQAKIASGPSMRDIMREKAYNQLLKTVAW